MATVLMDKAKKNKADEFYTRLEDIEKEMRNYKEYFKGKTIFCNCDDPYESNFFKYFAMKFNFLKIKKLIATCYCDSPVAGGQLSFLDINYLKVKSPSMQAYKIEINKVEDFNNDGAIDLTDVKLLLQNKENSLSLLQEKGDFRSAECIELLKQSDIVISNPPFSLFREYVAQLEEFKKKYIIIGNTNALTYKEIFKLIKEDRIRTGYTNFNVGMYFYVPDTTEKYHKIENSKKMVRVSTSCWFTSLPVRKHKEDITLYRNYNESDYPKYDNYDAINCDTFKDIPCDYFGNIGVPITFLDKFNPEQFELVGNMSSTKIDEYNKGYPYINSIKKYARVIIKRRNTNEN